MTQLVVENIKVFNLDHRYRKHYASFLQLFRTRVERPFEETLIFHAYRNDRRPRFHLPLLIALGLTYVLIFAFLTEPCLVIVMRQQIVFQKKVCEKQRSVAMIPRAMTPRRRHSSAGPSAASARPGPTILLETPRATR